MWSSAVHWLIIRSYIYIYIILVGGFRHDFYFPFHICDVILPIDELIFFKMVKTTNQYIYIYIFGNYSYIFGNYSHIVGNYSYIFGK